MKKKYSYIKYIILGSILFLIISGSFLKTAAKGSMLPLQQGLASELLRFHVVANSDSAEDQEIKMKIKEAVIDYLKPILSNTDSMDEAKTIISSKLEQIEAVAQEKLDQLSVSYGVTVELGVSSFPIKQYGDIVLPPGDYEALRIFLGDAEGKNWWCIMFPQLCFVDNAYAVVPEESKDKLKHVLTEEEYESIVQEQKVEVRFRLFDWLIGKE